MSRRKREVNEEEMQSVGSADETNKIEEQVPPSSSIESKNLPNTSERTGSSTSDESARLQPAASGHTKARMSQEDRLKYMAPIYARRLRQTAEMMDAYLARGEGTAHEIEKRNKALQTLYTMVENDLHEAAVEYAIKNGIRSSLLQGGGGFPSLTGAHFDYIVTVMPHRTAEMRELVYQRRMTGWKTSDRTPKLPETDIEQLEENNEGSTESEDELDEISLEELDAA